jgi:phage terminase small subunit
MASYDPLLSQPWRTPRPPACLLPRETPCMATPTPRPAKLKLLNGVSPGRDSGGRLVKPPPNFERSCPEPPADLGAEALAEWERITSGLDRLNLLKSED